MNLITNSFQSFAAKVNSDTKQEMEHMQTYLRKEVLDVIKKQEGKLEFLEKEQDLLQSTVDTHVKKQLSKLSDDMQEMKKELGSDL